jgi:hypothetical protein
MRLLLVTFLAAGAIASAAPAAQQSPRDAQCPEWHQCRELALAAADRGEYETFHDLAWRAVQTGPPRDPALMYLLARARALSGRPHDALIMLLRLAEMGVAEPEALTSDDFRRTRELPGWAEAEPRIAGSPGASPSAAAPAAAAISSAPAAVPPPPTAAVPKPPPLASATAAPVSTIALPPAAELRFSTAPFAVSGLAYDALSSRFVLGDRGGHKLILVDERSKQTMDLVRGESAGFLDITAVEIDPKRGDLWVASTRGGAGILHRLQLSSGRPIRSVEVASELQPARLVDLTVSAGGTVLVLDAETPRLFALRPRATSFDPAVALDVREATSVAAGADDRTVFVAHAGGITHVDLSSHAQTAVAAPAGTTLAHLERIRRQGDALIAVQRGDDGSRRVLRLEMNKRGTAIAKASQIDVAMPSGEQIFVTTTGDDLLWLTAESPQPPDAPGAGGRRSFTAYRAPLQ